MEHEVSGCHDATGDGDGDDNKSKEEELREMTTSTTTSSNDVTDDIMDNSNEPSSYHHHHDEFDPQTEQQHFPSLPPISLVSTCEEMNPSRRCTFEDCALYAPAGTWKVPDENMAFLAICDGHGGRQMVEYLEDGLIFHVAAELNAEADADECDKDSGDKDILKRLERAFLIADIHSKTLGISTSGATVAACLITRSTTSTTKEEPAPPKDMQCDEMKPEPCHNDNMINNSFWTIYAANAGDARIVLGHSGKAHRMTKDHRTDDAEEVRRIEQSGGFLFKGRVLGVLAVTRSLGDHCMKEYVIAEPYTQTCTIEQGLDDIPAFVILACDGLWDVMNDQEAVDFVLQHQSTRERAAQYLVKEALGRGSTDNITVSVAWL